MNPKIDPTNKSAFQYNESVAERIQEICEPFLKSVGLETFRYAVYLPDNKYLHLNTDINSAKEYLLKINQNGFIFQKELRKTSNKKHFFVWPNYKRSDLLKDKVFRLYHRLNIWNGFSIYRRHNDYVEGWGFATSIDNTKIINFYVNNLDLFSKFIGYFSKVARDIMEPLPGRLACFKKEHDISPQLDSTQVKMQRFINQTNFDRYHLVPGGKGVFLSKREQECVNYLVQGKTSKEIGKLINLSPRTVETYFESIKVKAEVRNKIEMAAVFSKSF